jgi:hypothetical protein
MKPALPTGQRKVSSTQQLQSSCGTAARNGPAGASAEPGDDEDMGEFEDQFGDEFEEEEVWEDVEETEGADMETDNADEAEKPRHQVFVPGKSDVEPNADLEYDSSAYALASTVSSGG